MARTKEAEGEPNSLTLLFKHGRTTILLLVPPQTPFPTILNDLLHVLEERYPNGLPHNKTLTPLIPIPDHIEDIALGVPIDAYEPSKGWQELATRGDVMESPKSLGLKDGSMLAFAFAKEGEDVEFKVEWSSYDDAYGPGEGELADEDDE